MTRSLRLLSLASVVVALVALSGCAEYFGVHDGYEDGEVPVFGIQGMAAYEILGLSPSTASVGEEVTVYTASESSTPVTAYSIDDFWFCTSDGAQPMQETGGADYNAETTQDDFFANVDTDLTVDDLDGDTISTLTFVVPDGSMTGEGFVITPNNGTEYFTLTIR